MPIKIRCQTCGAALKAPDQLEGKSVPCPKCQQPIMVPKLDTLEELEPQSAQAGPDPFAMPANPFGQPQPGYGAQPGFGAQVGAGFGGAPMAYGGQQMQMPGPMAPAWTGQSYAQGRKRKSKNVPLFLGIGAGTLVIIATIIILIVVLTTGDTIRDPLVYLPANSTVVASIRPASFIKTPVYQQLRQTPMVMQAMTQVRQQQPGDDTDYEAFFASVDSMTVGLVFLPNGGREPRTLSVMRFNRDYSDKEALDNLSLDMSTSESHAGETVYSVSGGAERQSVCLIDPRTLIIGAPDLVLAALKQESKPNFSPAMTQLLDSANMDQHVVLVGQADNTVKQMAAGAPDPQIAGLLNSAQGGILQLNATNDLSVEVRGLMVDSQTASQVLTLATQSLAQMKEQGGPLLMMGGLKAIVDSIQISSAGAEVTAKAVIPGSAIEGLLNMAGGM